VHIHAQRFWVGRGDAIFFKSASHCVRFASKPSLSLKHVDLKVYILFGVMTVSKCKRREVGNILVFVNVIVIGGKK